MGQQGKCGQYDQKAPFCRQQIHGSEGTDEKWYFRDCELEEKACYKSDQHQLVVQMVHSEY